MEIFVLFIFVRLFGGFVNSNSFIPMSVLAACLYAHLLLLVFHAYSFPATSGSSCGTTPNRTHGAGTPTSPAAATPPTPSCPTASIDLID